MDAVADFLAAYSTTFAIVGINALLALSVWVTLYAGQLTLGNAAFMAIGAYASALLGRHLGMPFPLALSRVAAVGITHVIAGALAVTVDASHGLTTASPRWVVSVGLGTVFSGISPVSPTAPLRRLKSSFGSAAGRSRGSNKIGACG